MATLKLDYKGLCAGGGHAHIGVLVNGAEKLELVLDRADLMNPPAIDEDFIRSILIWLIRLHRKAWKKANPTGTDAQYVAALEAYEWEF